MEVCISRHGYSRLKERNGWNKKASDRMVAKIYSVGQRPGEIKGYLKSWVNHKIEHDDMGREYILFGERLYIFGEGMMLTVLPIPSYADVINMS